MPALPAVSRPWTSRGNKPYDANAVQLDLSRSVIWSLLTNLKGTVTGGTATGTRDVDSEWVVKGSSDAATFNVAGSDLIASRANLVWANAGVAHSWWWAENAALGYQVVIDCITSASTGISLVAAPIGVPFTGGSLTARPTSTEEFLWGTSSTGSTAVTFLADTTTGATCNTHFAAADDGQFKFMASRAGTGIVFLYIALVKTTDVTGDTRNVFWLGGASSSARGAPSKAMLETSIGGCIGRNPNGLAIQTAGGVGVLAAGGTNLTGGTLGTDANSGKWNSTGLIVWGAVAGQYAYRGKIPDMYTIGNATIGSSIPSAAAQTRIVVGDYIDAFPGVALTV